MSAKLISGFLKEFNSIVKQATKINKSGPQISPETKEGITALIKAAPEIKAGEVKVAEILNDRLLRRAVLKRVDNYAPSTKEYLNIGTPEFALTQKTTERPVIAARTEKKLEDVKEYLEKNVNALKKGRGNFENLLNSVASENLKLSPRSFSLYKEKLGGNNLPEELQPIFDYFNKFATSERYKKMRGGVQFTPKIVKEIQQENFLVNKLRADSPEDVVLRFLYRSHRQPGTDVKLLNPKRAETGNWRDLKFQIGGRKIDFDSIKKGLAENDPLFAEVKDAYNYKKAVLQTKVMNPKTGMLEPLNKVSYDVLGQKGSGLFHMSHIYDVGRTPLSFIQITYGPYNLQMHNMLRGKKIPGGVESFLTRAKAVNLANPFAPDFAQKAPKVFAEEAALKLNNFYKLQKNKKSISFNKFMNFNKGGIVGLQNIKA
jgi:hypothetical protein